VVKWNKQQNPAAQAQTAKIPRKPRPEWCWIQWSGWGVHWRSKWGHRWFGARAG